MRPLRFRIRSLMIIVAFGALMLSVETTTTWLDPASQAILLLTCCLIAAAWVALSEFTPDSRARGHVPRTSITEDLALTLMQLSRYGSLRRSRRSGRGSPRSSHPAVESPGLPPLATWSLGLWTAAAFLWMFGTALANIYALSRMEETADDIRALRVIAVALLCGPALALTLILAGRLALIFREYDRRDHTGRI